VCGANMLKRYPLGAECSVRWRTSNLSCVRQRTEQCAAEADPKTFFAVRLEKVKMLVGGVAGASSTSPAGAARR
jgi:hypothetical protein